jgi:hypothetical protein
MYSPGVHILKDSRTGSYNFNPYLGKIVQPQDFNFDMLRTYLRPSQDTQLKELALLHQKRFIGASSSLVGLLSQLYMLVSNMKPINTTHLSHSFMNELKTFTRLSRGPFSAIILPKENGALYAIDPDSRDDTRWVDPDERILMDLGRSMEAMLILSENEYMRFLKTTSEERGGSTGKQSILPDDVFHYSTIEDIFVRSQLDCHHPALPNKTFDLKSRAALAIRYDVPRYREHLDYAINRRFGLLQSYERELYDMMRAAMLKYNFQVRLGRMDGIFITYHNTAEIFGFEYVPHEDMDTFLFGGTQYGNEAYRICFKLLNSIVNLAVDHYPKDPIRLLVCLHEDRPGRMDMFIEKLQWDPSNPTMIHHSTKDQTKEVDKYEINVFSSIDGFKIDGHAIPVIEAHKWEFYFRIDKDHRHPTLCLQDYHHVLSKVQDLRKNHPKYVDRIMHQISKNMVTLEKATTAPIPSQEAATSTILDMEEKDNPNETATMVEDDDETLDITSPMLLDTSLCAEESSTQQQHQQLLHQQQLPQQQLPQQQLPQQQLPQQPPQHQLPQQPPQHQPPQQQLLQQQPPQQQLLQHQLPQHQPPQHQLPQHQPPQHQLPQQQLPQHQPPQHQLPQHQPPQHQPPQHQPPQQHHHVSTTLSNVIAAIPNELTSLSMSELEATATYLHVAPLTRDRASLIRLIHVKLLDMTKKKIESSL